MTFLRKLFGRKATCILCSKQIPADEMTTRQGFSDLMGTGDSDDDPNAKMARLLHAATHAWKCDTCSEWICNACVCLTGTSTGASQIQHSKCGGMFRAPE